MSEADEDESKTTIMSLQPEVMDLVCRYCDTRSLLSLYRSCKWFYSMFHESNTFWKLLCFKEELANYACLNEKAVSDKEAESSDTDVDEFPLSTLKMDSSPEKTSKMDTSPQKTPETSAAFKFSHPLSATHRVNQSWSTEDQKSDNTAVSISTSENQCAKSDPPRKTDERKSPKLGYRGTRMRPSPEELSEACHWRKVFLRGVRMRRNIVGGNYEGYRIYANSDCPVAKLDPDLDLNAVKAKMGNFPKLSLNDDLKIDWNEQYLVVFHFVRREAGESCTIRVWDIENEPRFLFETEKGIECITDKISVVKKSVVMVPSWPIAADALVMTLDIDEDNSAMKEGGKFRFEDDAKMRTVDEHWESTMLRAVRNMAVVILKAPDWQCVIVDLPSCQHLYSVNFSEVPIDYECQQIRSYKFSALILFVQKEADTNNCLVTMHIPGQADKTGTASTGTSSGDNQERLATFHQEYHKQFKHPKHGSSGNPVDSEIRYRSVYKCTNTFDAALFTDPEEIFLMKKNGDVVQYDPNTNTETVTIENPATTRDCPNNEYQLFVNRKEQICVMQSSSEVSTGRNINVYSYDRKLMYTLNLDLVKYGLSRDESICIYTNAAFLAAADSKKFVIFDVKTGRQVGELRIPAHLERGKAKEEKFCMYDQMGLSLFIFDEDKLVAVHDYERCFPAVLDIYKFW